MKSPKFSGSSNPLSDLISDEVFNSLQEHNLLNKKSLRDHCIRKKFQQLRKENKSATEAISIIRQEHPYLQFDTIRKIVYNII